MNKYIIILFFSIGISSCSLLKNNNIIVEKTSYSDDIQKKILELNISPDWTSLKAKLTITKEGKNSVINSNISVKKDSVIWISLKAPLGIEIFRAMITPDSVYYMSRLDKKYFIKPISYLKSSLKADIDFYKIQEILFSSPLISDLKILPNKPHNGKYIFNSDNNKYIINSLFRVEKMESSDDNNNKIIISFNDFSFYDDIESYYPRHLYIQVESEEKFIAEILFSKIQFNKKTSLSFKIPPTYVEMD